MKGIRELQPTLVVHREHCCAIVYFFSLVDPSCTIINLCKIADVIFRDYRRGQLALSDGA